MSRTPRIIKTIEDYTIFGLQVKILQSTITSAYTIELSSHIALNDDVDGYKKMKRIETAINKFVNHYNRAFDYPFESSLTVMNVPVDGFQPNKSSFIGFDTTIWYDERKWFRDEMNVVISNLTEDLVEWLLEFDDEITFNEKKVKKILK